MTDFRKIIVTGISETERAFQARIRLADQEVLRAVRESLVAVNASAGRRAIVASQTNVQESTSRRKLSGRSPLRMRLDADKLQGLIYLQNFWTNAKSPAIINLYRRHGLSDKLRRTHLWVDEFRRATNRVGGAARNEARLRRQHESRTGLIRRRLEGRLLRWAMGKTQSGDVGDQHLRSIVRPPAEVRLDLVLGPAAREKSHEVVARIQSAVKRAMRRGR